MALMRRNIHSLLAILFIISTIFTSLHELMPHHNSSDCQVCTLVQHDNGLVPPTGISLTTIHLHYDTLPLLYRHISSFHTGVLSTRAPPLYS